MKKISIIVPVYNEEKTVRQLLNKVISVKIPLKKEIICIDDGSTDNSANIIKEVITNNKNSDIKYIFKKNQGKGSAIKKGFEIATGDIILIQDADLEYNPNEYLLLIKPLMEDKAYVVYGSRFLNLKFKLFGKNKTIMPLHYFGNKFLTFITNLIYNSSITDMETGYKVFKKNIIKNIKINSNKFNFEPEITAKLLKRRIKILEVPVTFNPRSFKNGKKITIKDGVLALWYLIKYRFID